MKTKVNSLLVIAAGFALSAAGAYGQDHVVAHIPFDFTAGGQAQGAGEYAVRQQGAVTVLMNQQTGKKISAGIGVPEDYNPSKTPSLTFACSGGQCGLSRAQLADGHVWKYRAPQPKANEEARVVVIYLDSRQAE